jgi:hypothetical protein
MREADARPQQTRGPILRRADGSQASGPPAAAKSGEQVAYLAIGNRNHFTILEDLASSSGVLTQALARNLDITGR